MTKIKFILAVAIVLLASRVSFAQDLNSLKLYTKTGAASVKKGENFAGILNLKDKLSSYKFSKKDIITTAEFKSTDLNNMKSNLTADTKKKKNPFLGALMSAVIPGSGELYGGNLLKAIVFFGVEVAGWGVYAYLNHKGDSKTADFQSYADTYWSVRKYADWLVTQGFPSNSQINPNEPDLNVLRAEIMVCEQANFSHTMPAYGSQQFYELIGKYQNFQAGWTNLAHEPTRQPGPYYYENYHDQVFVDYAYSRQKANDYYDYANTSVWFVVLNHILSAADAAWTVSRYNNSLKLETGVRMNRIFSPYTLKYEMQPRFNLALVF